MRILILGCGTVGMATGRLLRALGHHVVGVRRTEVADPPFPMYAADAGELALHAGLGDIDAVLLAANPGVRRGRDNGLGRIARIVAHNHRLARAVYTGTTSLYADADGAAVAEDGRIDASAEAQALLAIEQDFQHHPNALVLRATALVGPTRNFAAAKVAQGGTVMVKGDPDRPFSYLHEDDLALLCVESLCGGLGQGVLNAAAPHAMTVRGYYELLAARQGAVVDIVSDGSTAPRRAIDAARLWRLAPDFRPRPP
jgi:nucleoside-diphosphate-sugar epimerase